MDGLWVLVVDVAEKILKVGSFVLGVLHATVLASTGDGRALWVPVLHARVLARTNLSVPAELQSIAQQMDSSAACASCAVLTAGMGLKYQYSIPEWWLERTSRVQQNYRNHNYITLKLFTVTYVNKTLKSSMAIVLQNNVLACSSRLFVKQTHTLVTRRNVQTCKPTPA